MSQLSLIIFAELISSRAIPYMVLTLAPILVATAGLAVHRYASYHAREHRAPQRLFVELCRRHGLDHDAERLLRRLAAAANLSQAAELFVLPNRFDAATAAMGRLCGKQQEKIAEIRQRLFGGEDAAPPLQTTSFSSCPSPRSLPS